MAERLNIGFKLPNCGGVLCRPEWAEPAIIQDLARRADAAGFDAVWLHDHLVTPRELRELGDLRFYEPLITMAVLAQSRPRLQVGVATVVLPLRDPVFLAKQIGTLDGFFPGRLIFGLGAGRYESEFEAVGIDLFAKRGRVSKEYLEILRALLTTDPVTHEGTYRTLTDVSMHPKPASHRRSPIWYAGNSKVASERAGRHADGWIGATTSPSEFAAMMEPVRAVHEADGLTAGGFSFAVSATVERPRATGAGDSRGEALHQHTSTITGSDAQIADTLNGFVDVGATHVLLSIRADALDRLHDDMEWFASEVLPLVEREIQQTANGADRDRKGGMA